MNNYTFNCKSGLLELLLTKESEGKFTELLARIFKSLYLCTTFFKIFVQFFMRKSTDKAMKNSVSLTEVGVRGEDGKVPFNTSFSPYCSL